MKVSAGLLLVLCCSRGLLAGEGEEGGGGGETNTAMSPCAVSLTRLESAFTEFFSEGLALYVNCLSFGRTGALVTGVLSGVNESLSSVNGTLNGMRLVLSCVEGIIVAKPSSLPPVARNMTTTACVECREAAVEEDICMLPCSPPCERCYNGTSNCSRCIACVDEELEHCYLTDSSTDTMLAPERCANTCIASRNMQPQRDLFNFCDCPSGYFKQLLNYPVAEELNEEDCDPNNPRLPELEPFTCVVSCSDNNRPGFAYNEELERCFACGREYCVDSCRGNSTVGECDVCLEETILYDHECFACPKSRVVLNAEEQEEELEEEREDQRLRQLELAISLPILCVGVIIFFVGMSAFAHHRYPHVNPQGHKRHRTKPEDLDNILENSSELESSQGGPADLWRARPTIRLR